VLGNDNQILTYIPDSKLLFTFAERLDGETLTHGAHPELNHATIDNLAKYALGVWDDKQLNHMLGDLTLPRQFTVEQRSADKAPSIVLHDTDLVFSHFGKRRRTITHAMSGLSEALQLWADTANVDTPESVLKLQKRIKGPLLAQLLRAL